MSYLQLIRDFCRHYAKVYERKRYRTVQLVRKASLCEVIIAWRFTMISDGRHVNIRCGNSQHVGARPYQEDSFGYSDMSSVERIRQYGVLAVLADGMGGLTNGKQVSEYVVDTMKTMFNSFNYSADISSQLVYAAEEVNRVVCAQFSSDGKSSAGSTLVAVFIYQDKLYWISVGDSRAYICRNGQMFRFNEDHDYFNQLLNDYLDGTMEMQDIYSDAQKDSLTSYIGNEMMPHVDSNNLGFSLQKGDKILLCSDGVYNSVSLHEMISLCKNDPQTAADEIIKRALVKEIAGQDNLTVMVINYD